MLSWQMSPNAWGVHEQLCAVQDRGGGSREDSRRIQGGEAGGADGVEEETSARRAGLALRWREQKEERKSLRHSSFLSTHLSVSAFSSPAFFTPHLDSLYPFLPPFSTLVLLPVQAPYVLSSFILFFHSFHSCLSLLCTFFPLLPLCVCFNHLLIAPSFHRERAWREICASAV